MGQGEKLCCRCNSKNCWLDKMKSCRLRKFIKHRENSIMKKGFKQIRNSKM